MKRKSVAAHEHASGLTAREVAALRARLEQEIEGLRPRLAKHLDEATTDSSLTLADEMDQASRHTEQAYLLRLADKERKLVTELEHALTKFAKGTYGVCEGTGEPIGLRRLEARPWARHSIQFKEQLERERGRAS